jgi:predicted dehydrogenase
MPDAPRYVILGRGRWSGVIRKALESEGRAVEIFGETRRRTGESDDKYSARLANSLFHSRAQIAWICVPPGSHVPAILRAAIETGLDVISESPWLCSAAETQKLQKIAREKIRLIGVHFEYCLLDEVQSWRRTFRGGRGMTFGGRFSLSRSNRHSIPALADLGCHLAAIRQYAVPDSQLGEIDCRYGSRDQRQVWLDENGKRAALIDFTANHQPIIQRYFRKFEDSLASREFPFSLEFAQAVSEQISSLSPT